MADERPPIEGDASDFEAAAKAKLAEAKNVRSKASAAARDLRAAGAEDSAAVSELERVADEEAARRAKLTERRRKAALKMLSIERSDGGGYQVHGPTVGGGRTGYVRPGELRTKTFRKEASAEQERAAIAQAYAQDDRAFANMQRSHAAAVERAEERQTTAVTKGAATRKKARGDERAAEGDAEAFEREARRHADRMAAALDPAGRRRLAERTAPITDPAEQARAAAELEAARKQRPFTPLRPRASAGGGAREVQEHIARLEVEAERRVQAQLERRETEKLVRAEAAERLAIEKRTAAELEAARAAEQVPARPPGAELIRHPTEFGRRVPGPFGQVTVPQQIGYPSDDPQRRTRAQGRRDVYAQNPRNARSSIGETAEQIAIYKSAALEQARQARIQQAATNVQQAAAQRHAENAARAAQAEQTYAQRLAEAQSGLRQWSAQLGVVDQAMRRHGTFTTEFISAAAKGEVAYREWGWQIGAAATKFGAWTAAGAGIYAALGAVTAIGQGAIQSASGVESLKRSVDNVRSPEAQQSFREQAAHFNVPIETVVDAQQRMGQVFHDQADAATAATAALYALQTGQVDVAQSTKDLSAISNAYGSSAQDLVKLFDELNFVQNNYNARIPDMETGIAAAAGSFKQLGGSLEDMVTLFTVLQLHGQSGNISGTIFRRVPNELAKASNQAVLRRNQIDPSASIMQVIQQAQTAIQRGGDARAIAAAIAGPQFAGRIIGLLTDPQRTAQIGGRIGAGDARGASERELGHVKDQATEVLKSIRVELGNLGSNLAQSGLATVFGAMAKSLVLTLSIVNSLLGAFNKWPALIKDVGAAIAVTMATLAGARRLGIGGALEGRLGGFGDRAAPYLIESDDRRTRRLVGKGLGDAVKQTNDEQERLTAASFRAAAERERAVRAEGEIVKDTNRRLAAGSIDQVVADERKAAANVASVAAAQKMRDASYAATAAIEQAAQQHALQAEFDTLMAATARRDRDAVAQQFAVRNGMFIRPSLGADVPAAEHVRQMMAAGGGYQAPAGATTTTGAYPVPFGPPRQGHQYAAPIGPQTEAEAAAAAAALGGAATRAGQARRALPQVRQAMSKLGAEMSAVGGVSKPLAAASVAGSAAVRGASIGIGAMATGVRGLFVSVSAMLGPVGWFIAALTAVPILADSISKSLARTKELTRKPSTLPELPDTKSALDSFNKDLDKKVKQGRGFGDFFQQYIDPKSFLNPFATPGADREKGVQDLREAAKRQYEQVAKARREGRPAAGLSGDQILAQSARDVEDFQRGRIDLNELNKREQTRLQEILIAGAQHKGATAGRAEQLKQQIEDMFKQADAAIQEGIEARYNLLRSQTDDPVEQAQLGAKEAAEKLKAAQDAAKDTKDQASVDAVTNAQAEVNNAKRAVQEALKAQAQAQLDALGALVNQGDVGAAGISRYISKLEAEMHKLRGSNKPEDIQRYVQLRGQLIETLNSVGKQDLETSLSLARSQTAVDRAYRNADRAFERAARTANKNGDPRLARQLRAARAQRARDELAGRSDYMDARSAVDQASGAAGMPRLQAALREIGRKVQLALRLHLRGTKEYMQLIAEQRQAEAAIVEEGMAQIQAQGAVAAAGVTDPVAQGQINLANLQQQLGYMRANPRQYGDEQGSQIQNMIAQVKQGRADLAQQITDQARELIDAQYALAESLNDDPVYQARLEAQRTATIVRRGGFRSPADRIRAQADANNAKRAAQDAAVQAQMENIDYDVEIGRITVQQQIAKYQYLYKTAKMGQQQRKELGRAIGRLKHEAETSSESFSLDVGNIRLPSVYEVHRAIREGRDARSRTVVNNSPTVNVNLAPGDDGSAVVRNLDRYLGTSARSAMRASADIGV